MMRSMFVVFGLLLCGQAVAQEETYVDKGACPGEGCHYGERWVASESVGLLERPDSASRLVATLQKGSGVQTVTGEVHTVPARFEVTRSHGDFAPGDKVLLYTYLGEGRFRLSHNGKVKEADLDFSPWGGSTGTRCQSDDRNCWGTLQQELKSDWWIKVRTDGGMEGWVRGAAGFKAPGSH